MRGMRIGWGWIVSLGLCVALVALGCEKSGKESTTAATASSEEAEPRSSGPSGGEVACHLHSCAPPRFCNRDKGVCELLPCTDSRECPYGYKCDFSRNVCR
jgi:hypothetical protein